MSRGLYGFRKNGIDKLTYNHSDSYPEGLGAAMLKCATAVEQMKRAFDYVEMVDENKPLTEEQFNYCKERGLVGEGDCTDWYWVLRGLQGDFAELIDEADEYKKAYMIDNHGFIKDSLFCEFAYIYDLDREVLEYYVGFQHRPQKGNRYGEEASDSGYYPCRLMKEYPLNQYAFEDAIVAEMSAMAEEDYKEQESEGIV